ncbi:MAG: T9SS type A sorting domain-containing protein [Bacteroidota bacterium]
MKKIITLSIISILTLFFFAGKAQVTVFSNNLETWVGNVPVGMVGAKTNLIAASINPYTVSAHSPTTAVKLENTTTSIKRFTTQSLTVTNGTTYTITYWVRGHGDIKLGLYDGSYIYNSTYTSINSSSWTQMTGTVTASADTSTAEFIFGIKNTVADIDHLQIDDIVITRPGVANPTISIYTPTDGATLYSADVPVAFDVSEFVVGNLGTGSDGHINYTIDGGAAQSQFTILPINLTGLSAGVHQVILQLVDTTDVALTPNKSDTVNFTIDLTLPNPQPIHNIQLTAASPANSPYMNMVVTTSGIVTAVAPAGYFIQDGTGMWNGIYIYDDLHTPAIGDSITLTGTVKEYYGYTEFASITGFTVHSSGNTLPAPITVTGPNINDTIAGEPYEGVLVKIFNAECTKLPNNYGEWTVFDTDSAFVDDLMYHFTPVLSTHYDVTGIIYLTYGTDFIEPRDAADVVIGTGLSEISSNSINIYPNPVSDIIYINNADGFKLAKITNLLGRDILQIPVNSANISADISNLPNGIYFVSLINKNGIQSTKKFVKE